ncbi:CRISPR-associated protein Csm4 (plasmid) [Fulvitalea axinellae]|uniref:CRISPR system Cms protein Csm4 n=2 Tax=Fulvitalea axinellae TaxID=1182444 RepID=A0AAU9D6E4_9BACT|nr:CRISPR-associated protein Csm4 [Fulvitalea axinellae]
MRVYHIYTRAGSRFHFGATAVDNLTGLASGTGHMPSDSLFSALVNCLAKYDGEMTERLIGMFDSKRVSVSSVFYFLEKEGNRVYFLPKPVDASNRVDEKAGVRAKEVKKVRFVSKGILDRYGADWAKHFGEFVYVGSSALALAEEIGRGELRHLKRLYATGTATHVNTRPHSGEEATELYETAYMALPEHGDGWETGMYFLCDTDGLADVERKLFDFAVRLLRFEGLGGKRSSGYGFVDRVEEGTEAFDTGASDTYLSLGLCVPENAGELGRFEAYELCVRGGRHIGSAVRLKRVNMIREGALLSGGGGPLGSCVDVSPDGEGSYLRLGICLVYPLGVGEG